MTITFDNNPDKAVEEIYTMIKTAAQTNVFTIKHVEAIAELTTEFYNRLKVEENGK